MSISSYERSSAHRMNCTGHIFKIEKAPQKLSGFKRVLWADEHMLMCSYVQVPKRFYGSM